MKSIRETFASFRVINGGPGLLIDPISIAAVGKKGSETFLRMRGCEELWYLSETFDEAIAEIDRALAAREH